MSPSAQGLTPWSCTHLVEGRINKIGHNEKVSYDLNRVILEGFLNAWGCPLDNPWVYTKQSAPEKALLGNIQEVALRAKTRMNRETA